MALELRLYNTLTRNTEPLSLRKPGEATIYCCGPTVYDVPHVGHARAALAPDLLVRRLDAPGRARSRSSATSPTSTTRSWSARRRTARARSSSRGAWPPSTRRDGELRLPAAHARAARERAPCPRSSRSSRSSSQNESAYVLDMGERQARRVLRGPQLSRLRQALAAQDRRPASRRARRARRTQARPARLRAVEGRRPRRVGLGFARGAAAARAGTSSARRWPRSTCSTASTSTAAGWT